MAELLTRPFVFYLVFFVLFLIRTDTNKNYENETKNLLCSLTKIFTDKRPSTTIKDTRKKKSNKNTLLIKNKRKMP